MSVYLVNEVSEASVLQEIEQIQTTGPKDTYKIRGSSLLQTLNEVNSNRRLYSLAIGERFVESANERIDKNRMLGELDHPIISNLKDPSQLKRQMVVLWERVSHMFTRMWIENNTILGLMETTSNRNGIDLAKMAHIDRIPIGFSCRAMGKVKPSSLGHNIVEVTQPAHFVTYDAVTDPSHKTAQLNNITSVISSAAEVDKIYKANIVSESNQIALDESFFLSEFREFFVPPTKRMKMVELVESYVGKLAKSDKLNEDQKVNKAKCAMDMLLEEYLGTSDKESGISTESTLNESNVHDLMKDYAYFHNKEYESSRKILNRINSFLK